MELWRLWKPVRKSLEFITDLPWRVSNLRTFFRTAWYFNSCDWDPSFEFLRVALLENAKTFDHGSAIGREQAARECRIAAELIRRLQDPGELRGKEYIFYTLDSSRTIFTRRRGEHRGRLPIGMIRQREYQYMLGHLIGRKMMTWWD